MKKVIFRNRVYFGGVYLSKRACFLKKYFEEMLVYGCLRQVGLINLTFKEICDAYN